MTGVTRTVRAATLVLGLALTTVRCNGIVGGQANSSLPPDVVYHNGKIATVNAQFEMAQAVAVRHGRIVAVGSDESVRALASPETRLVDLEGKTVLPGFYDNHTHLGPGSAPDPHRLDQYEARSVEEVLAAIQQKTREIPKGEWIEVELPYTTGYRHPFPESKLPTRWDLDKAAPDHPIYVTRGHVGIVNTLGLQKAGITKTTVAPGGVIVKDAKGELTGKLNETPTRKLVTRVMPPRPRADVATARAGMQRSLEGLLSVGITRGNVPGIEITSVEQFRLLQDLYAASGEKLPRLTVQIRLSPGYDRFEDIKTAVATTIREIEALPFHTGFGNDRLKFGAFKLSIDGAFSGPTAWTIAPYPDRPGFHGAIRIPEEALYPVAKRAHELGWQLGIHVIGDAAVQMTVNVLERILRESPRQDHRHYLHHVTAMPPEDTLKKIAQLGIIVASQPNWVYTKMQFVSEVLRGEQLETAEPQKTLMDHGIRVSYGSDGMPIGPVVGIYGAVTRKSVDGKVYGPGERISLEQAIRNYTLETAYMNFEEKDQGSLEVGKFADMIVLAEDIFTVDPERIKGIGILKTIVGGEIVYSTTEPARPYSNINHRWPAAAVTSTQ